MIDTIYSEVQNGCSAEINILSLSEDSSAKIGDWNFVIDTIYSEVQNGCSAEINILSLSEDSSAKIGDWNFVISWFVGLIHIKGFLR